MSCCKDLAGTDWFTTKTIGLSFRKDDGNEVLLRVVRQIGIEAAANRDRPGRRHPDQISIGSALRDGVGAKIAVRPGTIVDDDLLMQSFAELLP
jgi:hypothetical protein